MEEEKFKETIQFAIAKEIGASNFYNQAGEKADHLDTKELLLKFAKEEEGHQRMLEKLTMEKIDKSKIEKIPDFKTYDYTVENEYRPDMSYTEIVEMAIIMEEKSLKLFTHLKQTAIDNDLKKIFTFLADEESRHKSELEKLHAEEISR